LYRLLGYIKIKADVDSPEKQIRFIQIFDSEKYQVSLQFDAPNRPTVLTEASGLTLFVPTILELQSTDIIKIGFKRKDAKEVRRDIIISNNMYPPENFIESYDSCICTCHISFWSQLLLIVGLVLVVYLIYYMYMKKEIPTLSVNWT